MLTNDDLKNIKALSSHDIDTQWLPIGDKSGVVCGLDKLIIMAMTRDEYEAMASELLNARARIPYIGPEK
jgi:hypothetical protein